MENSPETRSGGDAPPTKAAEDRRGFLSQAIASVIGTLALLVPAVVGIITFFNPLRRSRESQAGEFMKLTSLEVLPEDGTPRRFPVIADRADAWNRFPNEPIGAVFLRRTGTNEVKAFSVICPHEGCAVQYQASPEGGKFFCPCHAANFGLDGTVLDTPPISPRPLDELTAEIRNGTEVWVKFQNFKWGTSEPEVKA